MSFEEFYKKWQLEIFHSDKEPLGSDFGGAIGGTGDGESVADGGRLKLFLTPVAAGN